MYNICDNISCSMSQLAILHEVSLSVRVYPMSPPNQPMRRPRANPAMNVALGGKSAVKKSMIQRKSEPTLGGLLTPDASFV